MKTNPFFNVLRSKLFTEVNGEKLDLPRYALLNEENNGLLGVVTDDYEIVPNVQVAEIFDEAFKDRHAAQVIDHLDVNGRGWKRHIVFDKDDLTFEVAPGDHVGVMLEIYNSYTGRSSYGYNLMGYRWICSNGQIMGRENIFSESFSHLTNALERIRTSFALKLTAFEQNVSIWRSWVDQPFSMRDMERYLDSRAYVTKKGAERTLALYEAIMNKEKHDQTKWGAYNTLTYMSSHEVSTRKEEASPLFSNSYDKYVRLARDFYVYVGVDVKKQIALSK